MINSLDIQIQNYIKAANVKNIIVKDLSKEIKSKNITNESLIIANVPFFLDNNYNNEEIILTTWSFQAELYLLDNPIKINKKILIGTGLNDNKKNTVDVWPVTYRIVNDKFFYPNHNFLNKINDLKSYNKIWYYNYYDHSKKSKISKVNNIFDLKLRFKDIKNNHKVILREKIRQRLLNFNFINNLQD